MKTDIFHVPSLNYIEVATQVVNNNFTTDSGKKQKFIKSIILFFSLKIYSGRKLCLPEKYGAKVFPYAQSERK